MDMQSFKDFMKKELPDEIGDVEITDDSNYADDLNIDSMALLTLLVGLGEHNLTFDDKKLMKAKTVKDLFECLTEEP